MIKWARGGQGGGGGFLENGDPSESCAAEIRIREHNVFHDQIREGRSDECILGQHRVEESD